MRPIIVLCMLPVLAVQYVHKEELPPKFQQVLENSPEFLIDKKNDIEIAVIGPLSKMLKIYGPGVYVSEISQRIKVVPLAKRPPHTTQQHTLPSGRKPLQPRPPYQKPLDQRKKTLRPGYQQALLQRQNNQKTLDQRRKVPRLGYQKSLDQRGKVMRLANQRPLLQRRKYQMLPYRRLQTPNLRRQSQSRHRRPGHRNHTLHRS
ncbi:uncharacterized protein LOC118279802 [Spodoptera frugiperda]|uniref:Uncharacterized protein LOC118279802 n=1 Tax=Spodoptera frugiperda TaxID=7108 RepID=A0A9R0DIR5_SPOFR|nr:uncharacterized protein LOC118279802 [Spodoptera frugiperda]